MSAPNFKALKSIGEMLAEQRKEDEADVIRNEDLVTNLVAALEATLAGLEAWVEIADDDDKRDSDNEAIAMARSALAEAKGGAS